MFKKVQLEIAGAPHGTRRVSAGRNAEVMITQVLTVSCKLKVSQSQAAKLDATLEAFGQALDWVNQNTEE